MMWLSENSSCDHECPSLSIITKKWLFVLVTLAMGMSLGVFIAMEDRFSTTAIKVEESFKRQVNCSWVNIKEAQKIRSKVSSLTSASQVIQVFKPDTPPLEMKTSNNISVIVKINQTTPVPKVRTCSIVGNAGILRESVCGDVIDGADVVIRLNLAHFGGKYGRDVGSKLNIMTLNLFQYRAVTKCFQKQPVKVTYEKFTAKCQDLFDRLRAVNGSILWHFKGLGRFRDFQNALTFIRKIGIHVSFAYSPNAPMALAQSVFNLSFPSTGTAIYTAATQLCSEIRLFGFYPFYQDPKNRTLMYHYYDKVPMNYTTNKHDMQDEFELLMDMDKRGVIRVINDCAGKWDNRILRCPLQTS